MSTEANKALVAQFFDEVFNKRNAEVCRAIVDEAFTTDVYGRLGPDGVLGLNAQLRASFADLHYEVIALVAGDDHVAAQWIARATHTGDFQGIAASGKRVAVAGLDLFAIRSGKLLQAWVHSDIPGLLRQISGA